MSLTTSEKGRLAIELCKLMGWNKEGDAWRVWCAVLTKDKIRQLVEKISKFNK